jgi:hypothetical protein
MRRTTKCFRLMPIYVGILPKSLFSPKSNTSSEEQFINDTGSSPMKLLFWKCNDWTLSIYFEQILPRDLGILSDRLLFAKLTDISVIIFSQHSRSSPNNKLFERLRCSKDDLFVSHMNVIVLWNKLLERFNNNASELRCGSRPLKRL